jgi:hypothetical protein
LYLESLEANPVAPFTYVLLIATYVPMPWLDMMARCKRFAVGFLRLGPEAVVADSPGHLMSTAKVHRNTPTDAA